ncbi:cytochrome P450 [Daldinia sp. FL1419]|nr:cytochrome P450 [Daldinia sp. FL1419]
MDIFPRKFLESCQQGLPINTIERYERLAVDIIGLLAVGYPLNTRHSAWPKVVFFKATGYKYLRAVIGEVLRITPAALAYTWRKQDASSVAASKTLVIDGHVIPPGVEFATNLYTLLHNTEYFPGLFHLLSERYLAQEYETEREREARVMMRRKFQPFVLGNRGCAGKSTAYSESSMALAKTIWYFNFERAPGEEGKVGEGIPESGGRSDR